MKLINNKMKLAKLLLLTALAIVSLSSCYYDTSPENPQNLRRYWESYVSDHSSLTHPTGAVAKSYTSLPEFRLVKNRDVDREVSHYRFKEPRTLIVGFKRRSEIYNLIADIFKAHGLPIELVNIALIESGFKTDAKSHAGAVGMWQFMAPTARSYGLRVGNFRDDRNDMILSTVAAARYLRDLYSRFQDWNLALAAYNSGGGRVSRAIKKANSKNYWYICEQKLLPPETRRFVPRIIAASLITRDPVGYGFAVKKKPESV